MSWYFGFFYKNELSLNMHMYSLVSAKCSSKPPKSHHQSRAPPRPALSWGILNMPCDVVSICQHLSGTEYISYFYHSCHEMLDKCHLKKVLFWFYFGSWFEGTVHRDRGGMMAGARGSSCQASHLQSGSRERYVIAPLFPFLFI